MQRNTHRETQTSGDGKKVRERNLSLFQSFQLNILVNSSVSNYESIRLGGLGDVSLALDTLLLHLRTILIGNIVFWSIAINTGSDPNSAICLDVRT